MVKSRLLGAVGIVAVVICLRGLSSAQTSAGPAFEVVSIKRNMSNVLGSNVNQRPDGGFTMVNIPVETLIARAYPPAIPIEMVGLPAWTTSERYDVRTTSSIPSPTPDQRTAMLRALLADRLRLAVHVESRQQPVYDLTLARSDRRLAPGLKAVDTDCERIDAERAAAPPSPAPQSPSSSADSLREWQRSFSAPPSPCIFRVVEAGLRDDFGDKQGRLGDLFEGEMTMARLAQGIQFYAGRLVVNKTGLSGSYRVRMNFDMSSFMRRGPTLVPPADAPPSIFAAVQEQLGLKLESTSGLVDVLVIDHVKRPTED